MAECVSFHLSKKYGRGTSDSELCSKWRYFVHVLERMKAEEWLQCEDSVDNLLVWSVVFHPGYGLVNTLVYFPKIGKPNKLTCHFLPSSH